MKSFPVIDIESVKVLPDYTFHTLVTGGGYKDSLNLLDAVKLIWSPEEGLQK